MKEEKVNQEPIYDISFVFVFLLPRTQGHKGDGEETIKSETTFALLRGAQSHKILLPQHTCTALRAQKTFLRGF